MTRGSSLNAPATVARVAGAFYVMTTILGASADLIGGRYEDGMTMAAAVCYLVVTVLFYRIFSAVNRTVSLVAMLFSLGGCVLPFLKHLHVFPFHFNEIILFGVYCLMIAWLVWRSTFLPRWLAAFMAVAGLGWLTYLSPSFGHRLGSYTFVAGLAGEGALTVWMLLMGVDALKWKQQNAQPLDQPACDDQGS